MAAAGKRRLVMLAPHFEIGGTDKFNLDLIERLQRDHGYEVSAIATRASPHRWRDRFERLTPDVFTLNTMMRPADYKSFLLDFLDRKQPDTVFITNSRAAYELLPPLRAKSRASFVDYLHIDDGAADGFPRLSLEYAEFLDSTIVSSEHLRMRQIEQGGDPERIHVCTTNIDPAVWDRTAFDVPDHVPTIAFIGRLARQKQPEVMAAAIKILGERGLEFSCLVAGDGEYRPWLEKQRIRNLKLLGAVASEQVREILAISDILFLPSENEGIALTLYEAMSMSVVPVAANVGGQSELVTEDCGVLIPPGAAQLKEYADALERLLRDEPLRRAMGERGRERICEHYTLEAMGNRMAELLERAKENRENGVRKVRTRQAECLRHSAPRNFGLKMRNLILLGRISLSSEKRRALAGSFDRGYYLAHQTDVAARRIPPLLHYALQGYLEDRHPHPGFDPSKLDLSGMKDRLNPLLWSIARR